MRSFLYPLVVIFSLPWRLNSHLTPSTNIPNNHEDIAERQMLISVTDEPLGQKKYTAGSGLENMFSLSSSNVKQHLTSTSHSEQQGIRVRTSSGEGETLNQRTKRNVNDSQYNSSTPAQLSRQTEETTKRELQKPSESNNAANTDYTTVQPTSMTHTKTSMVTTAPDFNTTITGLSTKGLKTTQVYNPGAAVAAIIGTTFVLMFVAILVILIRKRKIQKRQLENPEWAGPSPFLDGDIQPNLPSIDESNSFNKRGFSQISISRYFSQRLSKHLTLGRNTNQDVFMGDILQGSTFARQSLNELQEPNGNPVGQDPTKTEENESQPGPTSMDSPDTKLPAEETPAVTVDIQELTEQTDDISPSPSSGTGPVIKPYPTLVSIDLDSLSEEPAPLQTTDVGTVPPAPPLP